MHPATLGRIGDVANEDNKLLLPIEGYENQRLMTLKEALEPVAGLFTNESLESRVDIALRRSENPSDGLSKDECAAITLYTIEWPIREESLYFILNNTLRMADRNKLKKWFPYLRLFVGALMKLPPCNATVYRGMNQSTGTLYQESSATTWWGFSSCTDSTQSLQTNNFLASTGDRTMFRIKCSSARNIRKFSCFAGEYEILLLPGRHLRTTSRKQESDGLILVELEEINPEYSLIKFPDIKPWRQFKLGLCLMGKCNSQSCAAHGDEVILPLNVNKYDVLLDTELSVCPECKRYIECAKLGFCGCAWQLNGIKQKSPEAPVRHTQNWTLARGNTLHEFDLTGVTWRKLIAEVKPIDSDSTKDNNNKK